ncbi:MAG: beta-galactosidase, partial [Anaerolineae bacterium]
MAHIFPSQTRHLCLLIALPILCCLVISASILQGYQLVSQHRYAQRGVLYEALPAVRAYAAYPYGVNASLEQYASEQDLQRVLRLAQEGGFYWIRQHFPWAELEPSPGEYHWERWDRIVAEVKRRDLEIIAVLDTCPEWARSPTDRDNRFAPPQFVTTYGLFVRAFAQRYGKQITY